MKQVIYSPAHKGLKEYPLIEKPEKNAKTHFWTHDPREEFVYNLWLSSPPIAIVRDEDREWFSVPRGEGEYKLQMQCLMKDGSWRDEKWATETELRNYNQPFRYVAIPIKEGNNAPNKLLLSDSLASQSFHRSVILIINKTNIHYEIYNSQKRRHAS